MIEHQCEYRFTALIHTDACLHGVHLCCNLPAYVMRVNSYLIKIIPILRKY